MIIHTQTSIIGFTFNFRNGSSQSYNENSGTTNKFVIDLNNIYMTGVNIYAGYAIEALKFQLYDSIKNQYNSTEIIGNSQQGCFSYFNSSFFKSENLVIDSIKGCLSNNQLNYFPYLEFKYSFSQCPIQVIYPIKTETSTIMISSTISSTQGITPSLFFSSFVSDSFISSTISPSLKSSTISLSVFVDIANPIPNTTTKTTSIIQNFVSFY
jgi:hypothetical protein